MSAIYKVIGQNIKRRRKEIGMNQTELAEKIGFLRTSIVNLEQGRQRTPLDTLVQIAAILDITPGELLPTSLWPDSNQARIVELEQKLADVKLMLQEIIGEM